ncbi:hypothetical protein E2C01_085806 [Portunus trituberculatus]|uniref:Uncharacterized protein n=1 Tax=Portunus trituberculatus TaxID=210409 RepID=A0A5B7J7U7_PORTR|nr:hypothetical protein [Portunus trituberculatus]
MCRLVDSLASVSRAVTRGLRLTVDPSSLLSDLNKHVFSGGSRGCAGRLPDSSDDRVNVSLSNAESYGLRFSGAPFV